ncbi:MAG: T9SS type A sorting domain-containing protein [Chitinophagales bacterium]
MNKSDLVLKRIRSYSAFAASILSGTVVESQIIYTDVNPDLDINLNEEYFIDLNNDGIDDFSLYNFSDAGNMIELVYGYSNAAIVGSIATIIGSTVNFASALDAGINVGTGLNWLTGSSTYGALWASGPKIGNVGQWDNVTDKYLGLRISIAGNTFYGWARLDASHTTITLKDYAYNASPNHNINTGDEVAVKNELADFTPVIYFYETAIHIQLPENIHSPKISMYDIAGQLIMSQTITSSSIILINDFKEGIYLIKIGDEAIYYSSTIFVK